MIEYQFYFKLALPNSFTSSSNVVKSNHIIADKTETLFNLRPQEIMNISLPTIGSTRPVVQVLADLPVLRTETITNS